MREILFRGQTRKLGEKVWMNGEKVPGNWAYGGICHGSGDFSIIYGYKDGDQSSIDKFVVHTDTVGQSTGLTDKTRWDELTEEERNSLIQPRTNGSTQEEFYAVLTKLLSETVLNVAINKSILSSLYNFISDKYSGEQGIIQKFNNGLLADTPEYLEQFEAEGIKNLRK